MTKIISNDIEALSDAALDDVTGGLNPQPLPPHPDSFRSVLSFLRFGVNQHFTLPALNVFRFF